MRVEIGDARVRSCRSNAVDPPVAVKRRQRNGCALRQDEQALCLSPRVRSASARAADFGASVAGSAKSPRPAPGRMRRSAEGAGRSQGVGARRGGGGAIAVGGGAPGRGGEAKRGGGVGNGGGRSSHSQEGQDLWGIQAEWAWPWWPRARDSRLAPCARGTALRGRAGRASPAAYGDVSRARSLKAAAVWRLADRRIKHASTPQTRRSRRRARGA